MRNIAIILAAGSGKRFDSKTPKQFAPLRNMLVLEYSLDAFNKNSRIDEIAIVINKEYESLLPNLSIYNKNINIIYGGQQRYNSTYNALLQYNDDDNLLIHDSARPLVSQRIINDVINALLQYNCVNVAIDIQDTVIEVNDKNNIVNILARDKIKLVQTPQGFKRKLLKKAYDTALKSENFKTTDDVSVVYKYTNDEKIFTVKGDAFNIKLTTQDDYSLLEHLLQKLVL